MSQAQLTLLALQYKTITKGLIAYFEAVVKSEQHLAKELTKEATDLPLPLVQGNQFIQEDGKGWQSALYGLVKLLSITLQPAG